MDYTELAKEFLEKMHSGRASKQEKFQEGSHGEAFVLHRIKERDGETIPGDISEAMGISSARVAAALNSLEKKGFVTREIDVNDRRRIIVKLTPEGRTYEAEQEKKIVAMAAKMLASLGEQDAKEYVRISIKMIGAMSATKNDLCETGKN